ncbi:MAG: Bifunctional purine biosynthesis protein PurH [Candidatus Magasanikbacteria bacterium GW2011_GWA2_37_8]|uniref:Bifunctional purine biosynthesis protein PurH n=1 Tax=Candidatus Magasanikbacteria bacterium GW2011_GWA2_37_8 TaxID=1619036 RepID=A0A0G0KKI0_9BACT|nr:MAG: Bifunctional purine biosynthesis protein PurH [Candidatus Magasanikbacteria bacterium GW2011_GWA2_37_8]
MTVPFLHRQSRRRVLMKRAVLSVSDKTGLVEFAEGLVKLGFELVSTGGTAKALRDAGLTVIDVAEVTQFPECLDGRLKTLHPGVLGGILALPNADQQGQILNLGIKPVDLVVCNLYPFEAVVKCGGCTFEKAIENIDIGGPTMIRARYDEGIFFYLESVT